MWLEIVRPYSLEMSISSKYENREILRFCFSSKYGMRRQTIEYTMRQSEAHANVLVF